MPEQDIHEVPGTEQDIHEVPGSSRSVSTQQVVQFIQRFITDNVALEASLSQQLSKIVDSEATK